MALREEFESSGNWLFRWRSYLPLIIIAIFLITLREYDYFGNSRLLNQYWKTFCLLVCLSGLSIRIFTIGHTPKGTSGRNKTKQVVHSINTTGIYSMVRNPLYLGNFFMGLGYALVPHLWWLTLIYMLAFALYYERIIFAEEAYMRTKFGNEYLDWANATPVFIPKFGPYQKAALPFSWKNVLKREDNSFFSIIVILFILTTVGDYAAKGSYDFDLFWLVMLGAGFIIWLILRIVRKQTKLLKVAGR